MGKPDDNGTQVVGSVIETWLGDTWGPIVEQMVGIQPYRQQISNGCHMAWVLI